MFETVGDCKDSGKTVEVGMYGLGKGPNGSWGVPLPFEKKVLVW